MNIGGWALLRISNGESHVVPIDDLRDHELTGCWCCPARDTEDEQVVIHNSLDQRERYESGDLRPR